MMFGSVTVTGPPSRICFSNSGMTLPFEPSTFPKRVVYTGLREGEKLYEEVLNDQETTVPSFHEKIRIAMVREYDYQKVEEDVEKLLDISDSLDAMAMVRKMKDIVPEFISNNSVYAELDAKTVS